MQARLSFLMFFAALNFCFSVESTAEMTSDNYRIHSSVQSAGGAPTGSANFQLKGTVGQPSPLMDPREPPLSGTYDLYPGFWYALEINYLGDFDNDRDVDGMDLLKYISDSGGLQLEVFARDFGKVNYP